MVNKCVLLHDHFLAPVGPDESSDAPDGPSEVPLMAGLRSP